jgi:hypothetical protein
MPWPLILQPQRKSSKLDSAKKGWHSATLFMFINQVKLPSHKNIDRLPDVKLEKEEGGRNNMTKLLIPILSIFFGGLLPADVLHLRDGRSIDGKLVSATSRQIRFLSDGERTARTYDLTAVDRLAFNDTGPAGRSTRSSSSSDTSRSRLSEGQRGSLAVPEGSIITLRMIDAVDSNATNVGDTYRASLDEPIVLNGRTIAPKGADATVRVARVDQSGVISGREEIALVLNDITVNGRKYTAETEHAEVAAKSRSKESVKIIGGTAVVGAIIGAIAGGGKGAAIGAASGAGAGTAIQAIRGQKIEIPSETRLDFRLAQPMYFD